MHPSFVHLLHPIQVVPSRLSSPSLPSRFISLHFFSFFSFLFLLLFLPFFFPFARSLFCLKGLRCSPKHASVFAFPPSTKGAFNLSPGCSPALDPCSFGLACPSCLQCNFRRYSTTQTRDLWKTSSTIATQEKGMYIDSAQSILLPHRHCQPLYTARHCSAVARLSIRLLSRAPQQKHAHLC